MATHEIREQSLRHASIAGLSIPSTLPLLEEDLRARSQHEVVNRLLCMHAIAAASYGFDRDRALNWLRQQHIDALLTDTERRFLERGEGDPQQFQLQVEGMWALAWALSLVPQLDFWKDSDDIFVTMLPKLNDGEDGAQLRQKSQMLSDYDLISACDLAFCLHWAIRQAELENKQPPAGLNPYIIIQRRRALEWLLSGESWDAVSLDT